MSRVRPGFIWLARGAVAAMFLSACVAKIGDPAGFALAVSRYRILPDAMIYVVAIVLPWIELVSGAAVLAAPARWRAAGAFIIVGMLTVFTIAISLNMVRGIEASCGCFSTRADSAVSDGWNLLRNGALLWLGVAVFQASARQVLSRRTQENL